MFSDYQAIANQYGATTVTTGTLQPPSQSFTFADATTMTFLEFKVDKPALYNFHYDKRDGEGAAFNLINRDKGTVEASAWNDVKDANLVAGNYVLGVNGRVAGTYTMMTGIFPIEPPAPAPAPAPTDPKAKTEPTAQDIADKAALAEIVTKLKAGISVSDDELIFYKVKDSQLAKQAMDILDQCGGYDELRKIGLTDGQATDALGIYNVKIEPSKYESEKAIELIDADKLLLSSFLTYLHNKKIDYPDLSDMYQKMRSNNAVYTALREWNKARA